jgi:large conductance mechanosensitive channel
MYGNFLNAVIAFLIIAAVLFFCIVQPLNHLQDRAARRKTPEEPTERKCPECFSDIPKQATRCRFCTAKIAAIK